MQDFSESKSEQEAVSPAPGATRMFWVVGFALVGYVALCSGHRDRVAGADAWEHHRVVVALTRQIWQPGNPTYATSEPSIRYSPYMVTLAAICRLTGVDPYDALTMAAAVNTALLIVALRLLLGRFGEVRLGVATLLVMVSFWGTPPSYANSYALVDLPWHQVNPSACSFPLILILWSIFAAPEGGRWRWLGGVLGVLIATVAVLDHPMTGVFGLVGLFVLSAVDTPRWRRQLLRALLTVALVGLLCLTWPWYSFRAALTWHGDRDYWFNPYILWAAVTQWCFPGFVALLATLPMRKRPLIRFCLAGCLVMAGFTALAFWSKSPTLARWMLPGMIFVHLPIAAFLVECHLLNPRSWPLRLRQVLESRSGPQAMAGWQCLLAVTLLYLLMPQVEAILRQPHLARPWLDRLRGRVGENPSPRPALARVLAPVAPGDTVLSDPVTSWQVPSTSMGRIVAAMHYELFVPDQRRRMDDLDRFFSVDDRRSRREILKKYGVRWILVHADRLEASRAEGLINAEAVGCRQGPYCLMDAARWISDNTERHL